MSTSGACSPKHPRSHPTTVTLTRRTAAPAEGGRTTTPACPSADPAQNGRNCERARGKHQRRAAASGPPLRQRSATETATPVPQRTGGLGG